MVELGQARRSGFYRFDEEKPAQPDGDMELRDAIQVRNWVVHPDDAMLSLQGVAYRILKHEARSDATTAGGLRGKILRTAPS